VAKVIYENMLDSIGNTPYIRFQTDEVKGAKIYIKLEGYNPTGSIKDRACLYNIKGAIKSKKLKKGMTILDASSGNMACAIAYYGKIMGYKTHLVCGSKLTSEKKNFIEYFDGTLEMHGDYTIQGNDYCRKMLVPSDSSYCFLDQLHNENNPLASYETLGPEILESFPQVKAIVGSLGSGGSMYGSGRYIKENSPLTKVIAVEAGHGSKIPGTGAFADGDYITPFIGNARREGIFDDSISISIDDAILRTKQLSEQGIFVGFQTGGVLDACIRTIARDEIKGDVVMVSGDSGWKNIDKLVAHAQEVPNCV